MIRIRFLFCIRFMFRKLVMGLKSPSIIDKEMAKKLVYERVNCNIFGDEIIIIDKHTMEKDYGWIFFYNTKTYIETGDITESLAGNGPLVVEKSGGSIEQLGTAYSIEDSIRWYEERHGHR